MRRVKPTAVILHGKGGAAGLQIEAEVLPTGNVVKHPFAEGEQRLVHGFIRLGVAVSGDGRPVGGEQHVHGEAGQPEGTLQLPAARDGAQPPARRVDDEDGGIGLLAGEIRAHGPQLPAAGDVHKAALVAADNIQYIVDLFPVVNLQQAIHMRPPRASGIRRDPELPIPWISEEKGCRGPDAALVFLSISRKRGDVIRAG